MTFVFNFFYFILDEKKRRERERRNKFFFHPANKSRSLVDHKVSASYRSILFNIVLNKNM